MEVILKNNFGYEWFVKDSIYIKGSFFDKNNNFIEHSKIIKKLKSIKTLGEFESFINCLNGVFSIIAVVSDSVYIATDITRTFPVFYTKQDNQWIVSDNAVFLQNKYNLIFCEDTKREFILSGYVSGRKTLLKNLYQIQSAEVVCLKQGSITAEEYWTYASDKNTNKKFRELQADLLNIYERLAKRLISIANGKTIVIPLSGGYDSRLVLALLIKHGYKNVFCFTYGVSTSFEVKIAKRVAKKLNVELEIIEYSNQFIDKYFEKTEIINYFKYGSNFVSLPHLQDFLAVKYLKTNELIDNESIFVPGHSGDIFAGTHISKSITNDSSVEETKNEIQKRHYSLNNGGSVKITYYSNEFFPYSNMEAWSWKERQAKFIVNSLRIYEYFDYKFALPLWDKELADFFKAIPLEMKNRNFMNTYKIENNLFDNANFTIFDSLGISLIKKDHFIFLKKVLFRINRLFGQQKDPINNFDYLIKKLEKELGSIDYGCVNSKLAKLTYSAISRK